MPTQSDYKKARALPAIPAGPNRPADGATQHGCQLPAPEGNQPTAGQIHPWDNWWAPPEPKKRLRTSKALLLSRGKQCQQQTHEPEPAPAPELPPVSTQPAVPELPKPTGIPRYRIDYANGPNVVPKHHKHGNCPCRPTARITEGQEFPITVWIHNHDICPHGHAAREAYFAAQRARRKANAKSNKKYHETPNIFRDPALPPELLAHVYKALLDANVQLVLLIYDPITGRKRPRYPNWRQRFPEFPEIARHLEQHENALIGVVPHSVGAVVTDVDQGDWRLVAKMLGSDITNATRRRDGRHIWTLAP